MSSVSMGMVEEDSAESRTIKLCASTRVCPSNGLTYRQGELTGTLSIPRRCIVAAALRFSRCFLGGWTLFRTGGGHPRSLPLPARMSARARLPSHTMEAAKKAAG